MAPATAGPQHVAGLVHRDGRAEVALLVQGAGELIMPARRSRPQPVPRRRPPGLVAAAARTSSWMGRGETSATTPVQRQLAARVGLGLVVAGDGTSKTVLSKAGLFPNAL